MTEATEQAVRAAVAGGGGTVVLDFDGTVVLTAPLLVTNHTRISATGRQVTLSGGNSVRLFQVTTFAALELWDLTLADGRSEGRPGRGFDPGEDGYGGAILSAGWLTLVNCLFTNNVALGGDGASLVMLPFATESAGGAGLGGAIYCQVHPLRMTNCTFVANKAQGGRGGDFSLTSPPGSGRGGMGAGGAIFNAGSMGVWVEATFFGNEASGGIGGNGQPSNGEGGAGEGGALWSNGRDVRVEGCTFTSNQAIGGGSGARTENGGSASGGALFFVGGSFEAVASRFTSNSATGGSVGKTGRGGDAQGGAVWTEIPVAFIQCLIEENTALSGSGGSGNGGSLATGGGIHAEGPFTLDRSTIVGNSATGGRGMSAFGNGGKGFPAKGGGVYCSGVVAMTNTTLTANVATGGACDDTEGIGGDAWGGGTYHAGGTANVRNVTLVGNRSVVGAAPFPSIQVSGTALGDNLAVTNGVFLANTILAGSISNNCYGAVGDVGGNLSSDGSCNFTATSSRNNVDPMLGPLADNGGPTPTMALLPGSPAIDFGVAQFCAATDQRGQPRPMGAGCDSGAYEADPNMTLLTITMPEPGSILIHVNGPSGSLHILERSTGASSWVPVWTNSSLPFDYLESVPASTGAWWYRSRAEP